MHTVTLTPDLLASVEHMFRVEMQGFYDSPWGCCDDEAEIIKRYRELREVADAFGFDYPKILAEETTAFERERVEAIVAGKTP